VPKSRQHLLIRGSLVRVQEEELDYEGVTSKYDVTPFCFNGFYLHITCTLCQVLAQQLKHGNIKTYAGQA
jgi:hypothetical protein